jgi:2-polyprenyl-6-methoxyphenol hydroxylase-like FAD-dependent oxidoreductase
VGAQRADPAVVIGGSIGGLATALGLVRRGTRVVVFERDRLLDAASVDEAFAAHRSGVPQFRHSHIFRARTRGLLADNAPDVLAALLAAGARVDTITGMLPAGVEDRSARDGDEQLGDLHCRRAALELALRDAVRTRPNIELRDDVTVVGLRGEPAPDASGVPHVTGVRDDTGMEIAASVVVDASGKHSQQRSWLAGLGVQQPEDHTHPCGIVYVSRWYRRFEDAPAFVPGVSSGEGLGSQDGLGWSVFTGDGDAFSLTMTVPLGDRSLLRTRRGEQFDAIAATVPDMGAWVDRARCRPEGEPLVMGGLVNRRRALAGADGRPLVTGFHAVGDAQSHTNPSLGWGSTLALTHAFGLAQTIADVEDPFEQAVAEQAFIVREIDPWYWYGAASDGDLPPAPEEPTVTADATPPAPAAADADEIAPQAAERIPDMDVINALGVAQAVDPDVYRAIQRVYQLLDQPQTLEDILFSDGVAAYIGVPLPPAPPPGPGREQIVAALDAVDA